MDSHALIVKPETRTPAINVHGVMVTVLASGDATGSGEITLQEGQEGMGPPPHSHNWDESFFILEGSVEIQVDGRNELCGPGTLVHVPAGSAHGFRFGADGGKMLEFTGRDARATDMFKALADEIRPDAPDLAKVKKVFDRNGVALHI